MNTETKRFINAWLLLVVFVPLLFFSLSHVHAGSGALADFECDECVQHQCHGHLSQLVAHMDDCVLCQFLTLTFVATALAVAGLCNKSNTLIYARCQGYIHLDICGKPALRAPPYV